MTILMATKRESFAVLATERLKSKPDGPAEWSVCKIVPHEDMGIPLAFGLTTQNACWVESPGQQGRPMLSFLKEVAAEIVSTDELRLHKIAERLKRKLQPGYVEMKVDAVVGIALYRNGLAEIGFQFIGSNTILHVGVHPPFVPGPPSTLASFYTPRECASLHDPSTSDPKQVVELLRAAVVSGIKHEIETVPQEKHQVGGKVDVVLVDAAGARLV